MNNAVRRIVACAGIAGLVGTGGGCGRSDEVAALDRPVMYVDSQNPSQTLVLPSDVGPRATNPVTGKDTLVRGMYCSGCGKWYPLPTGEGAPRPEVVRCKKHDLAMTLFGPLVDDPAPTAAP